MNNGSIPVRQSLGGVRRPGGKYCTLIISKQLDDLELSELTSPNSREVGSSRDGFSVEESDRKSNSALKEHRQPRKQDAALIPPLPSTGTSKISPCSSV